MHTKLEQLMVRLFCLLCWIGTIGNGLQSALELSLYMLVAYTYNDLAVTYIASNNYASLSSKNINFTKKLKKKILTTIKKRKSG